MKILFFCLAVIVRIEADGSQAPRYRRSIEEVRSLANLRSPTSITSAATPFINWIECSDGSNYFNGSCYKWSGDKEVGNWFVSELKCRAEGGHLVSIISKEESLFIQAITSCKNEYWIGLVNTEYENGQFIKPSGWSWFDRNEHRYTRLSFRNSAGLNCAYAAVDGDWDISYCSHEKRSYVCKKPLTSLTTKEVEHSSKEVISNPDDLSYHPNTGSFPKQSSSLCPNNWVHYDNHCYYFSNTSVNYFHAHLYCFEFQAHVVTIKSPKEHAFVQTVNGCENRYWIGLERAIPCLTNRTKTKCWEWSDLSAVNYQNWKDKSTPEDYYECAFSDGFWENSEPCNKQMRFVCKRAVQ